MATSGLPPPGTHYGPCLESCKHLDCRATLTLAKRLCALCGMPIGFNRSMVSDVERGLLHADCASASLAREHRSEGT